MAGPRFIELEIFNDSFSVDVEPLYQLEQKMVIGNFH